MIPARIIDADNAPQLQPAAKTGAYSGERNSVKGCTGENFEKSAAGSSFEVRGAESTVGFQGSLHVNNDFLNSPKYIISTLYSSDAVQLLEYEVFMYHSHLVLLMLLSIALGSINETLLFYCS